MNPAIRPTVLIYRSELLPASETFIAAQAHALRRFTPLFTGLRHIHHGLPIDREEMLVLTHGQTLRDRIRRRFFLETGIAPRFFHALQLHHAALLHAHFAVDAAAALPIQRDLRLPLVVTLHGYDATMSDEALRHTAAGRVYLRRKAQLRERASVFLCVSDHIRRQALERGVPESKLRTLPIGVDLGLFAPDPLRSRSRDPIVLFVGRLVEKKGCAHLIRAMAEVHERHPAAKLLIVGDGPLLDPLRAQAHNSAAPITFLGTQPPAVVRDLMHRAGVLAFPSVVASTGDTEGLPIVLCEAQAIGLPIAAFRGPGVEEAVVGDETALLAPSGDDRALAAAISAILSDPDLAARLAAAGRRRAELRFSLAAQTARLEDLYAELLAPPAMP
ncbi:MAG: glycosyltransferase [Acidobacteriaceae bacterium]